MIPSMALRVGGATNWRQMTSSPVITALIHAIAPAYVPDAPQHNIKGTLLLYVCSIMPSQQCCTTAKANNDGCSTGITLRCTHV
mmetsp:Transcript_28613/g.87555  ORF Transcript_28613/g.87555 Transcript_28613/m.87555 type:complete len:84 (-) Transcript_28613:711-962(-)